ncbi:2-heptaprenyl- -naphthoquinone [Fusarium acutatum]|uniref:2-heptaprenyl- -naphthoquinone n=1 Tax=Fusarium acutatum TaxID=78861 RepID=A0A8H4JD74_9HYPO|nr:2-heptaprenyl- -naphthoquinone [Fusarium acutatum]
MTAFFVDWELWQEMTFVLGCCIVLVFAMGLVKLWWSNRAIRRLEIIDEEKRARISLMSRCGIENMRAPEIPFGVRAILSGVEVEGIWISRPNSPGPCQLTPVATQVGRRIRISKGKGEMIDIGSSECLSDTLDSETTPSYPTSTKTSQQDGIVSTKGIQSQQEHVDSASSMTKTQVDSIVRRNSQINCDNTDSVSSSSCNDDFITPEQTPPGSAVSQTEAFEEEKGHSVSDTIFSIEQLNALPHTIHDIATKGFDDAQSYDAHRPSYPPAAVTSLLEHLGLEGQSGRQILDLAAGTGKFTELLSARPEGYKIIAVEPLDSMRNTLVAKKLSKVDVRPGTAAEMKDVGDGWADGCIVAQAFHWFAREESLKEIHRVLKPGAKLGLIWNAEEYNRPESWPASTKWEQELSELNFNEKADNEPRFRHLLWKKVFERQAEAEKPFFSTPIETERITWSIWLTPDALWDRFDTLSWNKLRQGEERRLFREKFDKIIKEGDATFNENGEVELHGCTFFVWTSRLDGPE